MMDGEKKGLKRDQLFAPNREECLTFWNRPASNDYNSQDIKEIDSSHDRPVVGVFRRPSADPTCCPSLLKAGHLKTAGYQSVAPLIFAQ